MVSESSLQKDKIDLAMSRLEKLKHNIASVEAKYNILDGQFSVICDEALTKIYNARSTFEEPVLPTLDKPDNINAVDVQPKTEPHLQIEPETDTPLQINIDDNDIGQQPDIKSAAIYPQPKTPPIDYVAEAIETGLDKLGDALVYPFDVIARLHKKLSRNKSSKYSCSCIVKN